MDHIYIWMDGWIIYMDGSYIYGWIDGSYIYIWMDHMDGWMDGSVGAVGVGVSPLCARVQQNICPFWSPFWSPFWELPWLPSEHPLQLHIHTALDPLHASHPIHLLHIASPLCVHHRSLTYFTLASRRLVDTAPMMIMHVLVSRHV